LSISKVKPVRDDFYDILAGFTLLVLGIIMIFTPGPGTVTLLGLGWLAAEFIWARRIMKSVKRESTHLKDTLLRSEK
jgi:hypothetical protein